MHYLRNRNSVLRCWANPRHRKTLRRLQGGFSLSNRYTLAIFFPTLRAQSCSRGLRKQGHAWTPIQDFSKAACSSTMTSTLVHSSRLYAPGNPVPHRPSTLDIIVAAHTLLLLNPPFPDPVLKDLMIESYPSLAVHARLVLSQAFLGPITSPLTYHKPSTNTWSALIPTFGSNTPRPEPSELEKEFTRMRWGWIGLAIVSTIGYLWLNPVIVIVQLKEGEPKNKDEVGNLEADEVDGGEVLVDTEPRDGAATEASTA